MFDDLNKDIGDLQRKASVRIQRGEWLEICTTIIISFFEFFDVSKFSESYHYDPAFTMKKTYLFNVNDLISSLHMSIKLLLDSNRIRIGELLSQELSFCMIILSQHFERNVDGDDDEDNDETALDVLDEELKTMKAKHKRSSIVFEDVQQIYYRKQFKLFMSVIKKSKILTKQNIFESIPYVSDTTKSDFRFEPLIEKICTHLRSMIERNRFTMSVDSKVTKAATFYIKSLRNKFENISDIFIENIICWNNTHIPEDDETVSSLRNIYNECGVTELCFDFLALGVDKDLQSESLKMLIILLSSSGK